MKYEVIAEKNNYALILSGNRMEEYAVVYGLNKETGSWAHTCSYYNFSVYAPLTKEKALMYALDLFIAKTEENYISCNRLTEIATQSMHELFNYDECTAMDFFKDDLDLTEHEREFFGVNEMVKEFMYKEEENLFYEYLDIEESEEY